MIRLYNVLRKFLYLSSPEEPQLATPETEITEGEVDANLGLNKALDTYRKLIEKKDGAEPLSEKDQALVKSEMLNGVLVEMGFERKLLCSEHIFF